jgi:hypothetical protein
MGVKNLEIYRVNDFALLLCKSAKFTDARFHSKDGRQQANVCALLGSKILQALCRRLVYASSVSQKLCRREDK